MSKVPNCKDLKVGKPDAPGPGYYEKSNFNTIDGQNIRASVDGGAQGSILMESGAGTADFRSTTKREDHW